ncbi:MAG: hypothetical protein LBE75_08900 [Burkholderiales bacterium]|nr:hypothetical protein [Burkholderiales bacterium]
MTTATIRPGFREISEGILVFECDHAAFEITEQQLRWWAEELVAVADDGEAEEWKAAFAECWGADTTDKVIKIAREIWRNRAAMTAN